MTELNATPTPNPNPNSAASGAQLNATLAAQIAEKIKANSLNGETDDLTSFETKKKVESVKQKAYVFGLVIIAYLVFTYANNSLTKYQENKTQIDNINTSIVTVQNQIQGFKNDEQNLNQIKGTNDINNLITCINNSNLCDKVLVGVKNNLQTTRSYLLLTPLTGEKMEIDQKSILKHFNEYLLRDSNNVNAIGQLLNISFATPKLIEPNRQIYEIGVDTTITFPSRDAMMSMIEKIESGINPQSPLLIKINSLNYDIVKFEEAQTVNISFVIYHYKKELASS